MKILVKSLVSAQTKSQCARKVRQSRYGNLNSCESGHAHWKNVPNNVFEPLIPKLRPSHRCVYLGVPKHHTTFGEELSAHVRPFHIACQSFYSSCADHNDLQKFARKLGEKLTQIRQQVVSQTPHSFAMQFQIALCPGENSQHSSPQRVGLE